MRVKNHQKRAKVAFTKPFTIHLMRHKGDFSCRVEYQVHKKEQNG